jgi:hypothetical protein
MSEFKTLDSSQPATLGAVVEVITRLSTYSKVEILGLVSSGKIQELFPFRSSRENDLPPDTVAEEDLELASPLSPSREKRAAIVQASMPSSRRPGGRRGASRGRKIFSKR